MKLSRWLKIVWVFFGVIAVPVATFAGVPLVEDVVVTDVTTVSFSAIWTASESSTAGIEVYSDIDGTQIVGGAVITPHPVDSGDPSIITLAQDNGVMKVRVTGLEPDTTYYFQARTVSDDTGDPGVTLYPESAPFLSVTTESSVSRSFEDEGDKFPFSNDILIKECFFDDGVTPAEGTLLLAYVYGSEYPISSFVGDGVSLPYARIDLNNVFSEETYETLPLPGNESLVLVQYMGNEGLYAENFGLPCNDMLAEAREPVLKNECPGDFAGEGNMETSDLYTFSSAFALVYGFDIQFAPVWSDLDGNGVVDGKDLTAMADSFNNVPCPWCE